jgi:hypothetical protein
VAKPKDDASEYESAPKPELENGAGLHRVAWDLGVDGARRIKGGKIDSGDPAARAEALPGSYTARLSVGETTQSVPVTVVADPRVKVSEADRAAQVAFGLELRDALNRLADAVTQLKDIRNQLQERTAAVAGNPAAQELVTQSKALVTKLDSLEARIHNPRAEVTYDILAQKGGTKLYSRLAPLYTWAIEGDGAPTQGMRDVYTDQRKELDGHLAELRTLIDRDLAAINALAARLGVQHVVVPAPKLVP